MHVKRCRFVAGLALLSLALGLLVLGPVATAQVCTPATCGALSPPGGKGNFDGLGFTDAVDLNNFVDYIYSAGAGAQPASLCNVGINGYCNPYFDCEPTVGDLLALSDWLFTGAPMQDCDVTVTPALGALALMGPLAATGGSATTGIEPVTLSLVGPAVNLRGYSMPIKVTPLGGLIIDQVDVTFAFDNGGAWTNKFIGQRANDRAMVIVFSQTGPPFNTSTGIPTFITVNVHYSNGPGAFVLGTYAAAPADIPAYYENTITKDGSAAVVNEYSLRLRDNTVTRVPTTSQTGTLVLIIMVGLVGAFAVVRSRRRGAA